VTFDQWNVLSYERGFRAARNAKTRRYETSHYQDWLASVALGQE